MFPTVWITSGICITVLFGSFLLILLVKKKKKQEWLDQFCHQWQSYKYHWWSKPPNSNTYELQPCGGHVKLELLCLCFLNRTTRHWWQHITLQPGLLSILSLLWDLVIKRKKDSPQNFTSRWQCSCSPKCFERGTERLMLFSYLSCILCESMRSALCLTR